MRRYGIERQTLLVAMIPILVMAVLLDSYFITTRFSDLEHSLLERSQLLTRQLASSCEYAVFSGNTVLLKQNVDAVQAFPDVQAIAVLDDQFRPILDTDSGKLQSRLVDAASFDPVYQDDKMLRMYEPIRATQINLDGLVSTPSVARQLGAVVIEISKKRLNKQKAEISLLSLLSTLMVFSIAMILALRTARRITQPIMQMHHTVRRIAEGDRGAHAPAKSKIRELDELGSGIHEMSLQIMRDRDMLETRIVEVTDGLRETKEEVEQIHQEKEHLNESLALALSELQAIMEANPDILYVFDKQGRLSQWNSSLIKFFGLPMEKLQGRDVSEFVRKQDISLATAWVNNVYGNGSASAELQLVRGDGAIVPYLCNGVVLKSRSGAVTGFTGTGRDISERKAAAERMQHMAHYDMLTDLPNRVLLSDRLQQAISTSKREHSYFAVMFLDLDMFKYINDRHGHEIGDLLLKEAAKRVHSCLRESDTAARVGGDEFVVLLPSIDSIYTAKLVAEKIRHALSMPFSIAGRSLLISTSIGIALYPEHGTDEKTLLRNADTAMYQAKQNGRNTAVFFSS